MVLRSSAWSLPWEKVILMMLSTPCGVDFVNTLLYHLKALQLSFFLFFLFSFPTLSEGYNTTVSSRLTCSVLSTIRVMCVPVAVSLATAAISCSFHVG